MSKAFLPNRLVINLLEVTWGFQNPRLFFLRPRTEAWGSPAVRAPGSGHTRQKHKCTAAAERFPRPPAGAPAPPRLPSPTQGVGNEGGRGPEVAPSLCPKLSPSTRLSSRGDPGSSKQQADALDYSLVRTRRRTPGCARALWILPRAGKQNPWRQQAAPWEVLLEDCAEEPRIGAQAGCAARERLDRAAGGSQRMGGGQEWIWRGVWRGWEHWRSEDRKLGSATGPQSPNLAVGWEGEVESRVDEGGGWSKRMQRLKLNRKWKEIFPGTRAGKDNQAGGQ
ncbi:uncharacterized protein [Equus caballus]|uniref:uncharacterized protein n=1 Tax=Equus caballus TaxID=9796 RepID=UPI0038B26BD8